MSTPDVVVVQGIPGAVTVPAPGPPPSVQTSAPTVTVYAGGTSPDTIRSIAAETVAAALDTDPNNDPAGVTLPDFRLYFDNALI